MTTFLVLSNLLFVIIIFGLLLKIKLLYKKLKYVDEANMWHRLAITDDLTGVYNRNAYNNQITKIKKSIPKKAYGIMLFDVDDFKEINDTKGHFEGDKVLQKVAKSLMAVFTEPKYRVFRIGGDEFSVIAENVSENEIIKNLLVLKWQIGKDSKIRLSKGYSIVTDDFDEAFRYADEMLYADKLSKNQQQ